MPYVSKAQERYFNVNRAKLERQGVNVDEWNKASKGKKLPGRKKRKKYKKSYKRIVDNKMRYQGETDLDRKVIKINKRQSKKKSTVIDTIQHEELHAKHPKMKEKTVRIETKNKLKRMSQMKKHKLYNLYR